VRDRNGVIGRFSLSGENRSELKQLLVMHSNKSGATNLRLSDGMRPEERKFICD